MTETVPGVYKRVGSKSGPLVIGGADKRMEKDSSFTYEPVNRIAAPLDELDDYLTKHHKKDKKNLLKGAYNLKNMENKKIRESFEREVENALEERQAQNQLQRRRLNIDLTTVINLAKWRREEKKDEKAERAASRPASTRNMSLKDKVKSLSTKNKVLDVTNMNDKGHKGRMTEWDSKLERRRLSTDRKDRFYRVIYNPRSENRMEGVRNFLDNYGGFESAQIDHVLDQVEAGGKVKLSPGRSPVRSKDLSPRTRRKASKEKKDSDKDGKSRKSSSKDSKDSKSKAKKSSGKKADADEEPKPKSKRSKKVVEESESSEDEEDDELFDDVSDDE
jgi:hypothetical protein